jgi:hypothetical protein
MVDAAAGVQATRQAYVTQAQGIRAAAEKLIAEGADPVAAARWAVEARNALKLGARESLPRLIRWAIEQRNIATNSPQAVIESAGRTNSFLNWIFGVE